MLKKILAFLGFIVATIFYAFIAKKGRRYEKTIDGVLAHSIGERRTRIGKPLR